MESETDDFQCMGSWIPITPSKPLQGRSSVVVDEQAGIRNTAGYVEPVHGNNGLIKSGSFQGGYTEFDESDDLWASGLSFTSLLSGGDNLFQVPHQYGALNSPPRIEADGPIRESSFQPVPSTPSLCRTGQANGFLESDKRTQSFVDPPAVKPTEVAEQKDDSRKNDLGFDLNKTPTKKPSTNKKKYLPKVLKDDKPKRKEEIVKSKETGSGKKKKAQKTNLKESATKNNAGGKSCRKALSFDLDKTGDARQGDYQPLVPFGNLHVEIGADYQPLLQFSNLHLASVKQHRRPLFLHTYLLAGGGNRQPIDARQDNYQPLVPFGNLHLASGSELVMSTGGQQHGKRQHEKEDAMVPFVAKKQKPRPKVDIDAETTKLWNLLMGKGEKERHEEMDKEKEKWWEEERRVLERRAHSFISIMHLVQGDRRFSPWKGSVVDSVVGVFLTQNVSDHLSSSAFMSLASRFPPKSRKKVETERNSRSVVVVEDPEGFILNSDEIPSDWKKGPPNPSSSYELEDIEDFGMQGGGKGKKKNAPRRQGGNVPRKFKGQKKASKAHGVAGMGSPKSSSPHQVHQGDAQHNQQLLSTFTDLLNSCDLLTGDRTAEDVDITSLLNIMGESNSSSKEREYNETNPTVVREMKGTLNDGKKPTSHWDSLRKDVVGNGERKERSEDSMDSMDYEAIRRASIQEISEAIKERGMNHMLAVRIKDFLERIVKDHGAVDLEWLREVPADKAKDYLLSIRGLGLKSVECVRLLTLHNLAFPVDTNVGRIAVRLGWVPLQTLPDSLQLHLLELYPVLQSIQKYLWPRLCKMDQATLYELHYQLITFGKVFCTKSKPNCNACPMRGQCRHYASAYASARLALPAPDERSSTSATIPKSFPPAAIPMLELTPPLEKGLTREAPSNGVNSEPLIEEPASPEQECTELTESDIEHAYYNEDPDSDIEDSYYNEDPDEIETLELNIRQFTATLREHMERNMNLEEGDMSKALVALNTTTTIPTPKLKSTSRLRTEYLVYVLPDTHPLVNRMDKRDPLDPSPYLLAIWTPGEENSAQPCSMEETVRGTILVPCRTATGGRFPLNGTYFQVNELFADHASSLSPIEVPRSLLWDLPRKTVFFGTSVTSIFRGLSLERIKFCFWEGFVCVRGFESTSRAPRPLMARLHFKASTKK
ncbi:unnamed protein product [Thlaspi arvense]|uniref:HhH-GPD domain-containing protein n=1 Tax=Thlaspi arvense TaxID=13288 RepID=A0AAU9SZ22_THLAR|nr:unnamed protein product [Thlaspi arvense]